METVLRHFGNSVGLVIPKSVRDALRLRAGQTVELETSGNGLLIKPGTPKYTLDELLAQCDPNAPMPQAVGEWQEAPAVGREAW